MINTKTRRLVVVEHRKHCLNCVEFKVSKCKLNYFFKLVSYCNSTSPLQMYDRHISNAHEW